MVRLPRVGTPVSLVPVKKPGVSVTSLLGPSVRKTGCA